MTTTKTGFLGSGMSYAALLESVEFSPNEPGSHFDDSMQCNVLAGRHDLPIPGQLSSDLSVSNLVTPGRAAAPGSVTKNAFGDSKSPALPPIRLLSVTNPEIWECF